MTVTASGVPIEEPVTDAASFIKKWGTRGWMVLIQEFISRAPAFRGDSEIAQQIGRMAADLESALEEEVRRHAKVQG